MAYAYVRNGNVRREFPALPESFENVSNLAGLSEAELRSLSIYPIIDAAPTLTEFQTARRTLVYDGGQQTVTANYEVELLPLPRIKRTLRLRIEKRRTEVLAGGCKVLIGANDRWIPTTTESRVQIIGMFAVGNALPAGLQLRDMEDNMIALNQSRVSTIHNAILNRDAAVFTQANALLDAVNAAPDPTTVDVESGWPEVYVAP